MIYGVSRVQRIFKKHVCTVKSFFWGILSFIVSCRNCSVSSSQTNLKSWKTLPFWEVSHILRFKTDLFRNFPQPARFHVTNLSQQWDLYHVYACSLPNSTISSLKERFATNPTAVQMYSPASFTYRRYRRSTQPTVQLSLFRTNLFNWSVLLAHSHAGYHDCSVKYTR